MKVKRLLALVIMLAYGTAQAQTPRARRPQARRPVATGAAQPVTPSIPPPVFLRRRGAATINEMMIQPPAYSYGSSINVWVLQDESGRTREIAVTGHGDSPTCRRVSGQVMSMFLEKNKEPEDLFVAGAAHLVDHGDTSRRDTLAALPKVQQFIQAQEELWDAELLVRFRERAPGEPGDENSPLGKARAALALVEARVDQLRDDPSVQDYLRESSSADAINVFVGEVKKFSAENGLVSVRVVPFEPVEQARTRIAEAAKSPTAQVISFEDLLKASGAPEAALFTPVLAVPSGSPLELRLPLASLRAASFEEARRSNRDEVEQAIVGNARQRVATFNEDKASDLKAQARCNRMSPEELRRVVDLSVITLPDGTRYTPDRPQKRTMEEYCKIQVPLNLRLDKQWINRTKELLKTIEDDAERKDGSRILAFNYTTLIDSMLRDWRLPVARSQAAFDSWRAAARGPVWNLLSAQLNRMGIAPGVIGGEQMVFSVRLEGTDLVVRPMHVIDMARSVVVADSAAGATRVLDAWAMRSESSASEAAVGGSDVRGLVDDAMRLLSTGDRDGAAAKMAAAFSRDPATAFREVEGHWLGQFPDTRQRLMELQRSLKPIVETVEWREAFESLSGDPSSKEGLREYLNAFDNFLESYPKAPVDLHLRLALELATLVAATQNGMAQAIPAARRPPKATAWDVIEAYGQPETVTPPRWDSVAGAGASAENPARQAKRQRIRAALIKMGYRGERLTKALDLWMDIDAAGGSRAAFGNGYIEGRQIVSTEILADPAPMIRKAVQTVMGRDPAYWAQAVKERGLPTQPSSELEAADRTTRKELTLFEEEAQLLARLEEGLRKGHWGSEAANYLWSSRSVDLAHLLSVIDVAVGDGSTGSSPYFKGPRQTVKLYLEQGKTMNTLTRVQNASSLQTGSETLLAIARSRVSRGDTPEPFSDAIPLRARLWFESGDYLKALKTLLAEDVPVALYSPNLSWRSLPGDMAVKPLSVKARRDSQSILFEATFEGDKKADVLAIDGLSDGDAEALMKELSSLPEQDWGDYGKTSDQILLRPVGVRPSLRELRELLLSQKLRLLLMKSMIYGRRAPGEEFVRLPQGNAGLERVVAAVDEVKGDQGRGYNVPTLEEVKQAAASEIRRKE